MLARPVRIDFSSQPCSARPASKRSSRWYSWRARLFSATVPPPFALSLSGFFLPMAALSQFAARFGAAGTPRSTAGIRMPTVQRSALVEHSAARMFALVNDIAAYPRRFDWCESAQVLEADDERVVARLDLGFGALRTWFTTENTLSPPHHIAMALRAGPFKRLEGHWRFHALDESACKVTLTLDFEPQSRLLAPAMALGFQGLADRMVDDFVRVADRGAE